MVENSVHSPTRPTASTLNLSSNHFKALYLVFLAASGFVTNHSTKTQLDIVK